MTRIKVRLDFTEILYPSGTHYQQSVIVPDVAAVLPYLDERSWIIESVKVIEYVGSDAPGREVPEEEWHTA